MDLWGMCPEPALIVIIFFVHFNTLLRSKTLVLHTVEFQIVDLREATYIHLRSAV